MYSIYVRDLPGTDPAEIKTLAIDVPDPMTASTLVQNIARSYPIHLADPFHRAYWFEDDTGCHEIWYEDDRLNHSADRVRRRRGSFVGALVSAAAPRKGERGGRADWRLHDAA